MRNLTALDTFFSLKGQCYNLRNERVTQNRFISNFMLVSFSSTAKFFKILFLIFFRDSVQSLRLYYKNNFCQQCSTLAVVR